MTGRKGHTRGRQHVDPWWNPLPPMPADVERWRRFEAELPERIRRVRLEEGFDGTKGWPPIFGEPSALRRAS